MSIQGHGYDKTVWGFGERPVTSAKLNGWDDRIEAAFELVYQFISRVCGTSEGVLRDTSATELAVIPTATPSMRVMVQPGYALINRSPYKLEAAVESAVFVAPTVNNRIDLVQASLGDWSVTVKTGTESPTPVAPSADAGCLPLAEVYLRPGMTSILNADDWSNGYITDVRSFVTEG